MLQLRGFVFLTLNLARSVVGLAIAITGVFRIRPVVKAVVSAPFESLTYCPHCLWILCLGVVLIQLSCLTVQAQSVAPDG
jgi:hypothetical protein